MPLPLSLRRLRRGLAALLYASALLPAAGLAAAAQAETETVIIHAGTLLAVPGEGAESGKSIIIRDGKIAGVRDGFVSASSVDGASESRVIDLSNHFVLPGLIDSHTHIESELGPMGRLNTVTKSAADWALDGAVNARTTLHAGFTTIRNVGARDHNAIFALRDAIAAGQIEGPRILASGRTLTPTGGHADIHGYVDDVLHALGTDNGTCDGIADCRRAVREAVKRGADHIKITATGGVLSNTAAGTEQQFFDDELEAIVQTAALLGREVTAHAHGKGGINAALRAGVDSIEHGTYLDAESIRLFKRNGAYLVPTVLAGATVVEMAENADFLTPAQKEKSLLVGPQMLDMLRRAREGGVKVAFGTDSGVSAHGDNAREFQLMVEAGYTPEEAIRTATVAGADHLGLSDRIGRIVPGLEADIIALDDNPLEDVSTLMNVDFVMKGGTVYKGE